MRLSESIKKAMDARGVTPTDVAKQTGYTPQYLHCLIDGSRRWNETTLSKTCDALGLEIKLVPIKKSKMEAKT
ncbi:helix-turn-helix transcriptional regulator [Paenibacillus polymyxa]|uniref:Helix-turn-helix transcriptional regulator n=1 Tax=Paenibacillus polymyxa TaxID=1406 RepID=A0A8I1LTW8_PAEPO|nr:MULTISPECIES: helix-turn-helix transcriptional regulator [Paenibacillus]KAF6576534.1 helix-turn-helix transcriptional regulator [Paenibacillus sp. EKM206P]KAF6591332.1 helix-turn-helix transcriptional regulator [Paenibacillus sp. EKM205P]MBM0632022.1 helix-turn-helix transcriptional regulator [Paenibacillus polymyxa]